MNTITINRVIHRNEERIALEFDYDQELVSLVKQIPDRKWSRGMKCWHIPYQEGYKAYLQALFQGIALIRKGTEVTLPEPSKVININIDQQEKLIYLQLPFEYKDQFKKLEGAWYHPGAKIWSAYDTPDNWKQLKEIIDPEKHILSSSIKSKHHLSPLNRFKKITCTEHPDAKYTRHMKLQGKSENTIRQYSHYVSWYLTFCKGLDIKSNSSELIRKFIFEEIVNSGYGKSQQNQAISALKLYYSIVYEINLETDDIPRPKRKRPLPKVISQDEFTRLLGNCNNIKHRIILMLLYGCGLRRNEVCQLRIDDVDFERGLIYVLGKGNKYRVVNPGKHLQKELKQYLKSYLPKYYLIEGVNGHVYTGSSIAKIVGTNAIEAGIKKRVSPHMLRHSFATHQMEKGTELRLIQQALGHASSKTTEIYTYVSRASIQKMGNLLDEIEF